MIISCHFRLLLIWKCTWVFSMFFEDKVEKVNENCMHELSSIILLVHCNQETNPENYFEIAQTCERSRKQVN